MTEADTIRSVTDHNVDRFIGLLELARSDSERELYVRLLINEEDKYACEEHRREALDCRIASNSDRIDHQAQLLDRLRQDGRDLNEAENMMSNLLLVRDTLSTMSGDRWEHAAAHRRHRPALAG